MLIEDHADTLETVSLLLRKSGHEVVTAACCAEARARAASEDEIEAVVGDLGLPDGDGVDLLVELKRQYGCPTIALTAYGMDADVKRCAAAGIDRHLLKPVGVIELTGAIEALCANGNGA
ncbi:MAG TPA: response regulator [Tepidisphaeraceae bacterium]|jgi:DNA-binding response OmpR family regulator